VKPSTRFLKNGKGISKVSDVLIILSGVRAASWLADQSYTIGIDAPASYVQGRSGSFLKLDPETLAVTGKRLAKKVEKEWTKTSPDGVVLHKLSDEDQKSVSNLVRHLP